MTGSAHAAGCTTSANPLSFSLPAGNFAVPRDAPVGTRLTPFPIAPTGSPYRNTWLCDLPANNWAGPEVRTVLAPAGMDFTEDGVRHAVFQTDLPGVGIIIGKKVATPSGWTTETTIMTSWNEVISWVNSGARRRRRSSASPHGPPSSRPVRSPVGPSIYETSARRRWIGPRVGLLDLVFTGGPTFTAAACTTSNVLVDLRSHKNMGFSGTGTTTAPTGFQIGLNHCPAGLNRIQYRADAVTAVADANRSVVSLDAASGARGVGVQLLDGQGNVLPLGSNLTLAGYNPAVGGNHAIPLQARYYQTAAPVTAGSANTSVTFTLTYQ